MQKHNVNAVKISTNVDFEDDLADGFENVNAVKISTNVDRERSTKYSVTNVNAVKISTSVDAHVVAVFNMLCEGYYFTTLDS